MSPPDLAPGDRIECILMPHDPDPVPPGTQGTVEQVESLGRLYGYQIQVRWDNGRGLALCLPPDRYRLIKKG